MRRLGIIIFVIVGVVLATALIILGGATLWVRGSLPNLDGELRLPGLAGPAVLERDSLGIAVIRTRGLEDAVRIQGYAHGQDRFFQMDLLRRVISGELSDLLGEAALPSDRRYRRYGYGRVAERHLSLLPPRERRFLAAYTEGVNAGLASLRRRPPEYLILRSYPEPWQEEDSLLAMFYFFDALATNYRWERHLHTLFQALPEELAGFLTPDATRFDAPVRLTDPGDPTGGYRPLPIPGPQVVDLRIEDDGSTTSGGPPVPSILAAAPLPGGSNAWVVLPEEGLPLTANDPHLPLSVPNVFYRVEFHWDGGRAFGAGPPGLPGIFIGLTDHLAWGLTAALADQTDLVLVEVDPADSLRYRTPDGFEAFRRRTEALAGGADSLQLMETRWGPVLYRDHRGRPLALRSTAYDRGGVSLMHLDLLTARDVASAQEVFGSMGGPSLSVLLSDRSGQIGWIVTGILPRRTGFDGKVPVPWHLSGVGWEPNPDRPMLLQGEPGYLRTANQRFLPLPGSRAYSRHWFTGDRAQRIDELLQAGPPTNPLTHADLQLDLRTLQLDPVRDLLLEHLPTTDEGSSDPELLQIRRMAEEWDGTARADRPHFRVLLEARTQLRNGILVPLLAPAGELDPSFSFQWFAEIEPVLRILEEEPAHLLPPGHEDWTGFVRSRMRAAYQELTGPAGEGIDTPWGQVNRARIQHPFGGLSTLLGWALDLPPDPLPGWSGAVRAQSPDYGPSLRFTGHPGDPETARFQMPGGQSGHFLSPFYRAGHQAWIVGDPVPLQAGPALHTLRFRPPAR